MAQRKTQRFSREVRRALLSYDFWKSNGQYGGGDLTVSVPGANYNYRINRNRGAIVIRGGRKKGRPECFLLIIEKNHTATLQSLKQAADCALNPDTTGRHLVEAALRLAREHHVTSLELDDISKKDLSPSISVRQNAVETNTGSWLVAQHFGLLVSQMRPTGASVPLTNYRKCLPLPSSSFKLGNLYFLTSGRTWYESLIPGLYPTQKADKIAVWRERVTTNRWSDVAVRLPPDAVEAVSISGAADGIDTTASGSAMVVLHRMKDARTLFFADWEDELLIASGIGSLYGSPWRTDSF